MSHKQKFLGLDIGERRIGIAVGDSELRLSWPHGTVVVDGTEATKLVEIIKDQAIDAIVVGRPRNQRGLTTAQTERTEHFVHNILDPLNLPIHWQDESVTSVMAEERLKAAGKTYSKGNIDAEAATIILQDYLEAQ